VLNSLLITHHSPAYRQAGCFPDAIGQGQVLLIAHCPLLIAFCLLLSAYCFLLLITHHSLLTFHPSFLIFNSTSNIKPVCNEQIIKPGWTKIKDRILGFDAETH
jgi:hypothetical protein